MKRFLKSETNRAFLLMMVGNVAFGVWIRPDVKRAVATAHAEDSPVRAVVLLAVSLALLLYVALEVSLDDDTGEPPPPLSIDL